MFSLLTLLRNLQVWSSSIDIIIITAMVFLFLTLTGLSMFSKFLPISNTGDSIAYILAAVHLLFPKLGSFTDMEY